MKINGKIINEESELIDLIKSGTNPLMYIENEKDIDFISSAISNISKSEDLYFDDMAEILLKSFIYYLLSNNNETKTLERCKELVELGLNDKNEKIKNIIESNESSKLLYTGINITSDKNYKIIYENLKNKLLEIL